MPPPSAPQAVPAAASAATPVNYPPSAAAPVYSPAGYMPHGAGPQGYDPSGQMWGSHPMHFSPQHSYPYHSYPQSAPPNSAPFMMGPMGASPLNSHLPPDYGYFGMLPPSMQQQQQLAQQHQHQQYQQQAYMQLHQQQPQMGMQIPQPMGQQASPPMQRLNPMMQMPNMAGWGAPMPSSSPVPGSAGPLQPTASLPTAAVAGTASSAATSTAATPAAPGSAPTASTFTTSTTVFTSTSTRPSPFTAAAVASDGVAKSSASSASQPMETGSVASSTASSMPSLNRATPVDGLTTPPSLVSTPATVPLSVPMPLPLQTLPLPILPPLGPLQGSGPFLSPAPSAMMTFQASARPRADDEDDTDDDSSHDGATDDGQRKRPRKAHMMTDRQRRAKIKGGMESLKQILAAQGMYVSDQVSIMLSTVSLLHSIRNEMSDLHHSCDAAMNELESVRNMLTGTQPSMSAMIGQRISQLSANRQHLAQTYLQLRSSYPTSSHASQHYGSRSGSVSTTASSVPFSPSVSVISPPPSSTGVSVSVSTAISMPPLQSQSQTLRPPALLPAFRIPSPVSVKRELNGNPVVRVASQVDATTTPATPSA